MINRIRQLFSKDAVAIELKRGSVYVIQATEPMSTSAYMEIKEYTDSITDSTGCQFVIIDHGFRLVTSK